MIKIVEAIYLKDYKIKVLFNNGEESIIDLSGQLWGEVFEPLKDKELFKKFSLNPFTIEWPNGADFAPEFLHQIAQSQITGKTVSS